MVEFDDPRGRGIDHPVTAQRPDEHEPGADAGEILDAAAFADFADLFDPPELRRMIEEWRTETVEALDAIAEALRHDDRALIGAIAHRSAGGGLTLGAIAFARDCERLRANAEADGTVTGADVTALRDRVAEAYAAMMGAPARSGDPGRAAG